MNINIDIDEDVQLFRRSVISNGLKSNAWSNFKWENFYITLKMS